MTKEQLGVFIKQQRMLQNITQAELAERLGCRRQVIIEIEASQCDYGISVLIKVFEMLGFQLAPIAVMADIPKYSRPPLFNFASIKPAQEKDDPNLQDRKRERILAQSNRKSKIKQ